MANIPTPAVCIRPPPSERAGHPRQDRIEVDS